MTHRISRFLDEGGRLVQWPAKYTARLAACAYLAEKFDCGTDYQEHEVNGILSRWHTFGDYFLLRRDLVDNGYLCRLPDGSRYWRNPDQQEHSS